MSNYKLLLKEYNPQLNDNRKPDKLQIKKGDIIIWECHEGVDHVWEEELSHRVKFMTKCPYCSNRRLSRTNSLAYRHPEIAIQWHPDLNGDITPNDVIFSTSEKFWFLCSDNHPWETVLSYRTRRGTGCPVCAKTPAKRGIISEARATEEIIEFMLNNERIPLTSENAIMRKIYFRLRPYKGSGNKTINHSWSSLISSCILVIIKEKLATQLVIGNLKKQYRAKLKLNKNNGWKTYGLILDDSEILLKKFPKIAAEIHPHLNYSLDIESLDYTANRRISWQCRFNHSFEMRVSARTIEDRNCPICSYDDGILNMEMKDKKFWHCLYPGYYYAKKVLTDYMVTHYQIPSTMDNNLINQIYKATRNPTIAITWGIANWPDLLRIVINELNDDLIELGISVIESYNSLAKKMIDKSIMDWILIEI